MRDGMFRFFGLWLFVGLLALGHWGCGDDDGTLPPPEDRGTIEVVNQTSLQVFMLFFRQCGTTDWGLDRLPNTPCADDGCIAPSETRRFTVEAGCHDLRADLADLEAMEVVAADSTFDFVVLAGSTSTWVISAGGPPEPE